MEGPRVVLNPAIGGFEADDSEEIVPLKDAAQPVQQQEEKKEIDTSFIKVTDAPELPKDEVVDSQATEPESNLDPVVERARSLNWRPKEEFEGDPSTWVDAKTFLERTPLYRKIDSMHRELKKRDKIINTMASTLSKAEEAKYKETMDYLAKRKEEAKNSNDLSVYDDAANKQKELERAYGEQKQQWDQISVPDATESIEQIQSTEAWKKFEVTDPWIFQNSPLATAAKQFSTQLVTDFEQNNPTSSVDERIEFVKTQVRKNFPGLFPQGTTNTPTVPSVGAPSGTIKGESGLTYGQAMGRLTPHQREMVEFLKGRGQDYKSWMKEALKQNQK